MAEALLPMVERYSSLGCLDMVEFGCVDMVEFDSTYCKNRYCLREVEPVVVAIKIVKILLDILYTLPKIFYAVNNCV